MPFFPPSIIIAISNGLFKTNTNAINNSASTVGCVPRRHHLGSRDVTPQASVVRPTLLYISSEAVIPAKAGIQLKSLDSGSSPE